MSDYDKSQPVMPDAPLELEEKTQTIGISSVNITFNQDIISLELANNSETATIYLNISGGVASVLTGIPLYPQQYYAADKKILRANGISLISNEAATDVRIIGHFNLESEIA